MNCNNAEKYILLSQSRELSGRKERKIQAHLAVCGSCRSFAKEYSMLAETARKTMDGLASPLPAPMLNRILLQAERRQYPPVPTWAPALRPLLAMAAGLVLIAGIWALPNLHSSRTAKGHHSHNGMADVSSLLMLMMGSDQEDSGAADTPAPLNRGDMARQILFLQGMNVESPEQDIEEVTLPDELQPTTLRWHSNPEALSEKCG